MKRYQLISAKGKRDRFFFAVCLILTSLLSGSIVRGFVDIGDIATDFTLWDRLNNKWVSLTDFEDHVVVIEFFGPNCGASQRAAYNLERRMQGTNNTYGVPIKILYLNTYTGSVSAPSVQSFVNETSASNILDDVNRVMFYEYTDPLSGGYPQFWVVSGVLNSMTPDLSQWEVVYRLNGYSYTNIENAVNSVQAGAFTIAPLSRTFGQVGGSGTINIDGSPGAFWEVEKDVAWISITSKNNAAVVYSVSPNSTYFTRTGHLGIGDQTHTVTQSPRSPSINSHPSNALINSGNTATLSVSVSAPSPQYQWYRGNKGNTTFPVAGATSSSMTTPELTAEGSETNYTYWVRISYIADSAGHMDSNAAIVTVRPVAEVVEHPRDVMLNAGESTTLTVSATGGTLTYQWYRGDSGDTSNPIAGATASSYTTGPVNEETHFWVQVSNAAGNANSETAVVGIIGPPVINDQPSNIKVTTGSPANLTISASGLDITYQWYQGESGNTTSPVAGAVGPSLSTPPLSGAATYWVRISNSAGFVDSTTIVVNVTTEAEIISHPQDVTITAGTRTILEVNAVGENLTYQWYEGYSGWTNKPLWGEPTSSTSQLNTPALFDDKTYWVKVSGTGGQINSQAATVHVVPLPIILQHPQDATVTRGENVTLSVSATGASSYQWYEGNAGDKSSPVEGADTENLVVENLMENTQYWVQVMNAADTPGSMNSVAASITVVDPPAIRTQPVSVSITKGDSARLSIYPDTSPVLYQWYRGDAGDESVPVGSSDSQHIIITGLTNTASFWVKVMNTADEPASVDSEAAVVTVLERPVIATQPANQRLTEGNRATLEVESDGASWQWYQGESGDTENSVLLEDATESSFTSERLSEDTSFWCRVFNAADTPGHTDTSAATIHIIPFPEITVDPLSTSVSEGGSVTLSVTAIGAHAYQWHRGTPGISDPIEGATGANFTTPPATEDTSYWVQVFNDADIPASVNSEEARVTVLSNPEIEFHPQSMTVTAGDSLTLTVQTNEGIFSYQWYRGISGDTSKPVEGALQAILELDNIAASENYWVQVANTASPPFVVNSNTATVTVLDVPEITRQPQDKIVTHGRTTTLYVEAEGAVSYQWYRGTAPNKSNPITNATLDHYTTPQLTANSAYWVEVFNGADIPTGVQSETASITIVPAPLISSHPQDTTINAATQAVLSVTAVGTELTYQWYQGISGDTSKPLTDAVSSTFTTPVLEESTSYWVAVSNSANTPGVVYSETAEITVLEVVTITRQPTDTVITAGERATLTVQVDEEEDRPVAYQWFRRSGNRNAEELNGATQNRLVTEALSESSIYFVRIGLADSDSSSASVDSEEVTVTVLPVPLITTQPASQSVQPGDSVSLNISVDGGGSALYYQWYEGATGDQSHPIPGATTATYTTPALDVSTQYWVLVGNDADNPYYIDSNTATITVGDESVPAIWSNAGAAALGDGWMHLDWFGDFQTYPGSNKIWHNDHGWISCYGDDPTSFFIWDTNAGGWLWTGESTYPFLYCFAEGQEGWLWFYAGTDRWFYDWAKGEVFYAGLNME